MDAQLPPLLCRVLERSGHSAEITRNLPRGNRSTDEQISHFCGAEDRIVVTKDKDFYYSHILHGTPRKLFSQTFAGSLREFPLERGSFAVREADGRDRSGVPRGNFVELYSDEMVGSG